MTAPSHRSTLRFILLTAFFAVLTGVASPAPAAEAAPHPRKLEIIALLKARDFAGLEAALSDGRRVRDDYNSPFDYADPSLEADLNAWVEASPDLAMPYLARAGYYNHLAWLKRGSRYARLTRPEQFAGMRHYFDLALRDLHQALARDDGIGAAYASLIHIALATSDEAAANRARRDGLAKARNAFPIHIAIIEKLEPKWASSWEELHTYISDLQRRNPGSPDYGFLSGHFDQKMALVLQRKQELGAALTHIDRAIATGDTAGRQSRRAKVLLALERGDEALQAIDNAIAFDPDTIEYYNTRARFRLYLGDFDGAIKDVEFALALDPYEPDQLLVRVEFLLRQMDRLGEKNLAQNFAALNRAREGHLRSALVHGAFDADVHQALAEFHGWRPEAREQAYEHHLRSVQLVPSGPKYWLSFAKTLLRANDCRAVETARRYRNVCAANPYCTPDAIVGVIETNLASCRAPEMAEDVELPLAPKRAFELDQLLRCGEYFGAQDDTSAIRACLALAEANDADAQFDMGMLYVFSGSQLAIRAAGDSHMTLAVSWLNKALAQDHTGATAVLGSLYLHGVGVPKDLATGLGLLGRAAERGNVLALLGLGLAYHHAVGVPKDVSKAETFYRRAAKLGSEDAARSLANLQKEKG